MAKAVVCFEFRLEAVREVAEFQVFRSPEACPGGVQPLFFFRSQGGQPRPLPRVL